MFPGQTRHIISPAHSDSTLGFSSQLCMPRKPPKGGILPLTRCTNHLNWLLNIKERGPYSEFLTVPLRLNRAGGVSHPQPRWSVPPFPIREPDQGGSLSQFFACCPIFLCKARNSLATFKRFLYFTSSIYNILKLPLTLSALRCLSTPFYTI